MADTTIRRIDVLGIDLALDRAVETASGVMRTTPLVFIELLTDAGIVGKSYVRCYTAVALEPLARLIANLSDVLEGHVGAPATVERTLQRHFRLLGPQGLTGIAMAGIDMALWDACAKACGVPLVTLLGGVPKPIPAYASLRTMNPHGAAAEAEEALAHGFTAIKMKVGRAGLAEDLETIHAVRASVGVATKLMVDYNQSLSVAEAIARGRALDREDISWIEEPTRADDFDGHARIAQALATPIQLGENWWGAPDVAKSIAAHASDHAMLDVMKLGGVTGWLRAAALVAAADLPASSHAFPEYSVHLLGVTPSCHLLEYLDHAGPILREPIRIENGYALTPTGPGAGLDWDEEAVRRNASTVLDTRRSGA